MSKEQVSFDIGLQDMLFSGAASFILLFFIFSIKIGGESVTASENIQDKGGKMSGRVSLVDSYNKDGNMKSIRLVEISGLSPAVMALATSNANFARWDLSDYSTYEKKSLSNQLYSTQGKLTYVLVTDTLKSLNLDFEINAGLLNGLRQSDKRAKIRASVIEGEQILISKDPSKNQRFDGKVDSPLMPVDLNGRLRLTFRIDDFTDPSKLFRLSTQ